jgi:hypothetical protein
MSGGFDVFLHGPELKEGKRPSAEANAFLIKEKRTRGNTFNPNSHEQENGQDKGEGKKDKAYIQDTFPKGDARTRRRLGIFDMHTIKKKRTTFPENHLAGKPENN